jgi:hypothetical protein
MLRSALIVGIALLVAGPAARAVAADLFVCREIVTGTDLRSRPEGLARCVRDVVVKVTGQPSLADDPRVAAIVSRAPDLVEDLAYVDRISDVPHHDEQGTRDRPYDLIVHLDPELVTAELSAAGLRPWLARPALLVMASVKKGGASFRLDADGDAGERQREALLAAADRFGMRVVLPSAEQLATSRMPLVRGGQVTLQGQLVWSDVDFGWDARWHLGAGSADASWEVRGVSFDEAFRAGVGGAAERLSRPTGG